jgi:predicted RNase H-like nuclease (RuvC/YqgF family)
MNNNHLKKYAILGIVTLSVGIFLGYYIWGVSKKKEEVSISALLTQALNEVRTIEQENINLKKKYEQLKESDLIIERLKGENAKLIKQINALKHKNTTLEAKIGALIKEKELLSSCKKQNEELQAKISELQSKTSQESVYYREKEVETLKAKIKSLQKENQDLKLIIEQIKALSDANPKK